MATDIYIFNRVEKKYRISIAQRNALLSLIEDNLIPDAHGKSTICSLYLDTPDHLLIRNSIDADVYKEKLRLRSYGTPEKDSKVFFEIKKKYKGVVYKRRVAMTPEDAEIYIDTGFAPTELQTTKSQIMSEIDYAMKFYNFPKPAMVISYEREAFYLTEYPNVRITFDHNIRYRDTDLMLESGTDGIRILPDDTIIMEIKTDGAMPIWLSRVLSQNSILPSSFSKYGTAYLKTVKGGQMHVSNF